MLSERTDRKTRLQFRVNGHPCDVVVHPLVRLLDVLRESLHLTGTKEGCGEGECGACSVLVDGELVNSCMVPVAQVAGCEVSTIEGMADDRVGRAVQDAFVRQGGAQCGICTPGMIVAAVNLLRRNPAPSEDSVRVRLAGNLCRCTGYVRIVESVLTAAQCLSAGSEGSGEATE